LPQVFAEKAEKRNRRENTLSAVFVNWFGAIIPLPYQKLPRQNAVRALSKRGRIRLAPYVSRNRRNRALFTYESGKPIRRKLSRFSPAQNRLRIGIIT
jgi:hypothetical protein